MISARQESLGSDICSLHRISWDIPVALTLLSSSDQYLMGFEIEISKKLMWRLRHIGITTIIRYRFRAHIDIQDAITTGSASYIVKGN